MNRLITFSRLPLASQKLVVEAAVELTRAKAMVSLRPFSSYSNSLGQPEAGERRVDAFSDVRQLREVRWAINVLNRTIGGRLTCLMKAMAVKRMLDRRGVPNGLVLGAKPPNVDANTRTDDGVSAHAWLWAGGVIIVGGEERAGFIPLTTFLSGHQG